MTQEGGSAGRTGEAERQRLAPVEVKVVNSHPDALINRLSVAGTCQSMVITGTADTQVGLRLSDNDVVLHRDGNKLWQYRIAAEIRE